MSFIEIRNVWQRYGDQVVLEQLNLRIAEGEFCTLVGASGCASPPFCGCCSARSGPARANCGSRAGRCPPNPMPSAAWCSSATRSFLI